MCGLKLETDDIKRGDHPVTPHVGVWIETWLPYRLANPCEVTPHVGVWIETSSHRLFLL